MEQVKKFELVDLTSKGELDDKEYVALFRFSDSNRISVIPLYFKSSFNDDSRCIAAFKLKKLKTTCQTI